MTVSFKSPCQCWQSIKERIKKKSWKELCAKTVPYFWLKSQCPNELTSSISVNKLHYIFVEFDDSNGFWRDAYFSWQKWRMDNLRHVKKNKITRIRQESISCIYIWEDVAAIGTATGSIYLSHFKDLDHPFFIINSHRGSRVTDIWFKWSHQTNATRDLKFLPAVVIWTCADGNLKFSSTNDATPMVYWSKFLSYCSNGDLYTISRGVLSRLKFSDNEMGSMDNLLTIPLREHEEIVAISSTYHEYTVVELTYKCPEVEVLTFDGTNTALHRVDLSTPRRAYKSEHYVRMIEQFPAEIITTPKKFFILNHKMKVCVSGHLMALSINNKPWFIRDLSDHLEGTVTCVKFRSCLWVRNLLAIGTNAGMIYVFNLKIRKDWRWENLDWENYDFKKSVPVKIVQNKEPVIYVEFLNRELSLENQSIVTASEKNIYLHTVCV